MTRQDIFDMIDEERDYQDRRRGGADHDRNWSIDNWVAFILPNLGDAVRGDEQSNWEPTNAQKEKALVKVAALAVAAIEQLDQMPKRGPSS